MTLEERIERKRNELLAMRYTAREWKGICADCRWYQNDYIHYCRHPLMEKVILSPVTGVETLPSQVCSEARSEKGHCGPNGELFEAKSKKLISTPMGVVLAILTAVAWLAFLMILAK